MWRRRVRQEARREREKGRRERGRKKEGLTVSTERKWGRRGCVVYCGTKPGLFGISNHLLSHVHRIE